MECDKINKVKGILNMKKTSNTVLSESKTETVSPKKRELSSSINCIDKQIEAARDHLQHLKKTREILTGEREKSGTEEIAGRHPEYIVDERRVGVKKVNEDPEYSWKVGKKIERPLTENLDNSSFKSIDKQIEEARDRLNHLKRIREDLTGENEKDKVAGRHPEGLDK